MSFFDEVPYCEKYKGTTCTLQDVLDIIARIKGVQPVYQCIQRRAKTAHDLGLLHFKKCERLKKQPYILDEHDVKIIVDMF